jgi:hypothetical protein
MADSADLLGSLMQQLGGGGVNDIVKMGSGLLGSLFKR